MLSSGQQALSTVEPLFSTAQTKEVSSPEELTFGTDRQKVGTAEESFSTAKEASEQYTTGQTITWQIGTGLTAIGQTTAGQQTGDGRLSHDNEEAARDLSARCPCYKTFFSVNNALAK